MIKLNLASIPPVFALLCIFGFPFIVACSPKKVEVPSAPVELNNGPECSSIESCIVILKTYEIDFSKEDKNPRSSGIVLDHVGNASHFFRSQESHAIDALVPLLSDPNSEIRRRAGYAIHQVPEIPPDYVGVLIAAHKEGVPWLEVPIGRTGQQVALEFLWLEFLYDPRSITGYQAMAGLGLFGQAAFPLIEGAISRCKNDPAAYVCIGLVELSENIPSFPKSALPLFEELSENQSLELSEFEREKAMFAVNRLQKQ